MNATLPLALAQALAPMAPPQSVVHEIVPTTAWDSEPTDRELARFYGNAPDTFEVATAIERHTRAIDKDDLTEICHEFEAEILAAIRCKSASALMAIFASEINKTIARRASFSIYGDVSVLSACEVAQ